MGNIFIEGSTGTVLIKEYPYWSDGSFFCSYSGFHTQLLICRLDTGPIRKHY